MRPIVFFAHPFSKEEVTLALESGVDAIITSPEHCAAIEALSTTPVYSLEEYTFVELRGKDDEQAAVQQLEQGKSVILCRGWEIIPVENILAQQKGLFVEVGSLSEARLAAGILQKGVTGLVVCAAGLAELKDIVGECKLSQGPCELLAATITAIKPAGLGHRVCVDTMTLFSSGQGMLTGNSSAFTFLVNAETEANPYVAARPFRVNAGGVHAYALLPGNKTCYLEEIASGTEILAVHADGSTSVATVGRSKVEVRPMLLIEARCGEREGSIFLQNAETIRLVRASGEPVSVVHLQVNDTVLCHLDQAGRHFGMAITESIRE